MVWLDMPVIGYLHGEEQSVIRHPKSNTRGKIFRTAPQPMDIGRIGFE